jgi:hypothetical protein
MGDGHHTALACCQRRLLPTLTACFFDVNFVRIGRAFGSAQIRRPALSEIVFSRHHSLKLRSWSSDAMREAAEASAGLGSLAIAKHTGLATFSQEGNVRCSGA